MSCEVNYHDVVDHQPAFVATRYGDGGPVLRLTGQSNSRWWPVPQPFSAKKFDRLLPVPLPLSDNLLSQC